MIRNGADVEHVERFANRDAKMIREIFTPSEIAYCESCAHPEQHFCGIYCAKEALSKAISGIVPEMHYRDFCVAHDQNGRPYFAYPKIITDMDISLSISHTPTIAIAFVVINL